MKVFAPLLLTFIIFGNQNLDSKFQFDDLVGEYKVYKTELVEEYSKGWNISRRYERTLILYPDSTYDEINLSFEGFDYINEFGSWGIKDGQLILKPLGGIVYVDGSYERREHLKNEVRFDRYLKIHSNKDLEILEDGFLKNEKIIKQVSQKD